MRYLRGFDEGLDLGKELQEFCDDYLVHLRDLGLTFFIFPYEKYYEIDLTIELGKTFKWYDIADYFIPFTQLLSETYNVDKFITFSYKKLVTGYEVDAKINCSFNDIEEFNFNKDLCFIEIKVMK